MEADECLRGQTLFERFQRDDDVPNLQRIVGAESGNDRIVYGSITFGRTAPAPQAALVHGETGW